MRAVLRRRRAEQDVADLPGRSLVHQPHRLARVPDIGDLAERLRRAEPRKTGVELSQILQRHTDAAECARVYWRSRAFALPTVAAVHDEREVRRWMADELVGRTDMWVAEVDGTVVGLMVLDHGRGGAGWIEHLYLDPAWVGRRLGERFLTLAAERLPAGIELWCFQVNDTARRFYERHGFVAEEFTDGSGNEERTPDVRYRRQP